MGQPTTAHPLPLTADGWRLAADLADRDSIRSLSTALGTALGERFATPRVIVARDGRAEGERLAAEVATALTGQGCTVTLTTLLPTPLAVHAVRHHGYDAAVLVTASHNPAGWTGIKVKLAPGGPPGREFELAVQRHAKAPLGPAPGAAPKPQPAIAEQLADSYTEQILGYFDLAAVGERRLRVVADGLGGAGGGILRDLLLAAGCEVRALGVVPDARFGGLTPDPARPEGRQRAARELRSAGAAAAFVLDGDGDRLGVLDDNGELVRPHDVLALLLPGTAEEAPPRAGVAATVEAGSIVRRAAEELDRETVETAVGFKHIAPLMQEGGAFAGGGGVGDIGFLFHGCDRDPMLAALMVVRLLAQSGATLSEQLARLHGRLGATAYETCSIPISPTADLDLHSIGLAALAAAGLDGDVSDVSELDGVKFLLGDDRTLLLRRGTTEPALRVNVEMSTPSQIDTVLESTRTQLEVYAP